MSITVDIGMPSFSNTFSARSFTAGFTLKFNVAVFSLLQHLCNKTIVTHLPLHIKVIYRNISFTDALPLLFMGQE